MTMIKCHGAGCPLIVFRLATPLFTGFRIVTEALNVVIDDVILIIMTGCPLGLMKFVAAKSVEIPEGKVIWLVL